MKVINHQGPGRDSVWRRIVLWIVHLLHHHWKTALFMACLLHLTQVQDAMAPLKTGALSWAQLIQHFHAPDIQDQRPRDSVVLISPQRFEEQYGGRRPLPRNALQNDLEKLPPNSFVALDIDVSPLPEGQHNEQQEHEARLYSYLKTHAARFLLILPFPVHDAGVRERKAAWLREMCEAHVPFADPRIEQSFGVVTRELPYPELSMSRLLREVKERAPAGSAPRNTGKGVLCEKILTPGSSVAEQLLTPGLDELILEKFARATCAALNAEGRKPAEDCTGRKPKLLPFGKAHTSVESFQWCSGESAAPMEQRDCDAPRPGPPHSDPEVVIFGGNYELADRFMTPLGELPGAALHATAMLKLPIAEWDKAGLLADFLLGVIFGTVAHRFWRLWLEAQQRRTRWQFLGLRVHLYPHTRWVALFLLAISLGALTALALLLAAYLLVLGSVWLTPVPMVVGMTLDALVLGQAGANADSLGVSEPHATRWGDRIVAFVPWLVWGTVIVLGLGFLGGALAAALALPDVLKDWK
ncbi:hypothetical protein [Hydrogenophaga palleronii]|uniref:hypothetical protein n=1 Tax=Hydrogenophaga palleronii TaxID=65655 RepID=UPI0008252FC0|nr:hypothetical protein [Hydrogenophaga palleronii]